MLGQILDGISAVNKKSHPYYYSVQVAAVAGISYLTSALISHITRVSGHVGMAFIVSAYAVHKISAPLLKPCFEPYSKKQNQTFPYKVAKWTVAILAARAICAVCGVALGVGQIVLLCGAFYIGYLTLVIALAKLTDYETAQRLKLSQIKEQHGRTA